MRSIILSLLVLMSGCSSDFESVVSVLGTEAYRTDSSVVISADRKTYEIKDTSLPKMEFYLFLYDSKDTSPFHRGRFFVYDSYLTTRSHRLYLYLTDGEHNIRFEGPGHWEGKVKKGDSFYCFYNVELSRTRIIE